MKAYGWLVLAVGLAVGAMAFAAGAPVTVDDVVKLLGNGVTESVIRVQIEQTNSCYSLSTDDLIKLKQAKASDGLVNYMISRKPGTAATTTEGGLTITNPGGNGVTVATAGRESAGTAETTPAETTPKKFVDLTVNLAGTYNVKSTADLNVLYAAFVDGEKKYSKGEWSRINTFASPETNLVTKKWALDPGSFTVKVQPGNHTLTLVVWSGTSTLDDKSAQGYAVYTRQITVAEGAPTVLNLAGETNASGAFVVR
jgi:hypothetical protein